jgi:hypothetical protein
MRPVLFSCSLSVPSFRNHVGNVIELSSQKQMIGIATCGGVASVKNTRSFRNRPISKVPRCAMGSEQLSIDGNMPVSVGIATPGPQPTIARSVYSGPKTFGGSAC